MNFTIQWILLFWLAIANSNVSKKCIIHCCFKMWIVNINCCYELFPTLKFISTFPATFLFSINVDTYKFLTQCLKFY